MTPLEGGRSTASPDRVFWCPVKGVQVSQTHLSRKLLNRAMHTAKEGIIRPFPVYSMEGKIVLLDGHHTACALFMLGFAFIPCKLVRGPIDMDMYRWAVMRAMEEGVEDIKHLRKRVVSHGDFLNLWVKACREYGRKRGEARRHGRERPG